MAIARLQAPLLFSAVCLYVFPRGIPHDPSYLVGSGIGILLTVSEVARRVSTRMKERGG